MKKKGIPNKICIFSGDISRGGGTERVGIFLANNLSRTGLFSVSIVSITEESSPHFSIDPGIPRFQLSSCWIQPGIGYVPLIYKLYKLIRKEKFSAIIDIDHVLDVLSIPCRIFTGISVISWEHFHFNQALGTWYRPLLRRFTCRYADHIVTLTEHDAITYREKGHPRCEVTPIHNAANLLDYSIPPNQKKEKRILAMGALTEIKGFDLLIEAARILVPQFPDWKFYIYGEGTKRRELEALIQKYHLEHYVFLPGYCSDVITEFEKSSIFLLTSRSEGLPMVLLEAKYFRLPSISFDIETGPGEIILDQVNGFLIPPFDVECMTDRLAKLMADSKLRQSFADHAWDNIDEFDQTVILKKWIHLLNQIQKK